MNPVDTATTGKRADARRNVAAILEAATSCLARDPEASVHEIAQAAGVGRVTLYGHFASRSALVAEVVARAMAQTEADLVSVDLSGDPRQAMSRLLEATWPLTHRFGALVLAAENSLSAEQVRLAHEQPIRRVEKLLRRGRRAGSFRTDMPISWQVNTIQALVHAASAAVYRGEITARQAPNLVRETVLAALTPREAT